VTLYGFLRGVARVLARLTLRIDVSGLENIPMTGPFLLIPNHQSILDPILVQGFCPRPVHAMTKSTQFGTPLFRWLLPRINSFPTRRYRIDPQAVRVVLRYLDEGQAVGIYAEGERSWDAALQPFRRGTIRLILKAGVPVVPCGITGSYDVWPRWSRRPRAGRVNIRFGRPIHFGRHDSKEEREAMLCEATKTLERAITELMQERGEPAHPRKTAP
jgi:1-acyl-sn-glycerol-3-phosphate acyltransferase